MSYPGRQARAEPDPSSSRQTCRKLTLTNHHGIFGYSFAYRAALSVSIIMLLHIVICLSSLGDVCVVWCGLVLHVPGGNSNHRVGWLGGKDHKYPHRHPYRVSCHAIQVTVWMYGAGVAHTQFLPNDFSNTPSSRAVGAHHRHGRSPAFLPFLPSPPRPLFAIFYNHKQNFPLSSLFPCSGFVKFSAYVLFPVRGDCCSAPSPEVGRK